MKIYEPPGIFRMVEVKPSIIQRLKAKMWFVQDFYGHQRLAVGIFYPEKKELHFWKSRPISPKKVFTVVGTIFHKRNPLLDMPEYKTSYRVPFLVNAS